MGAIRLEQQGAVTVMRLDKPRGNAIDEPLVEEVIEVCRALRGDDSVRGVLFASGHPKLFCPGLDLVGLFEYDRPRMQHFLTRFAEAMWALYELPKPVVAALSGHAVAGGCVLALTADYRVLRRGAQIGLNEVKVGLPLPWSVSTLLAASVPPQSLSRVALLGRNFEGDEALRIGLADELAEGEGFEAVCLERLAEFAEKDAVALATTKRYLRKEAVARMRAMEAGAAGEFLDAWFADSTRARLQKIAESLSKPRA